MDLLNAGLKPVPLSEKEGPIFRSLKIFFQGHRLFKRIANCDDHGRENNLGRFLFTAPVVYRLRRSAWKSNSTPGKVSRVDTLPPPIEAGDSSSWFSDRCHGFIHGLPQFPQAWIRPCHYLFAGSCCFLQYLPYQSFAFQSLIENVDCGIDISIMLRFAMRAFPVPYPEIFDGPILISASGTCLR